MIDKTTNFQEKIINLLSDIFLFLGSSGITWILYWTIDYIFVNYQITNLPDFKYWEIVIFRLGLGHIKYILKGLFKK